MKILILRFSSIGDIVLTTPVIRCLKTQLQNASIHYASKKSFQGILEANPHIDKIHLLDEKEKNLITALRKEKFDLIIDLHHNLRTFRIKKALGVKCYSYNKLNLKKALLVNFKINQLPNVHIVDRYMDTVARLGVKNDLKGLDYYLDTKDHLNLDHLPHAFKNEFYAFAIGGQHHTKRMPNHKLIELCEKLKKPIVLLGGKEDVFAAQSIQDHFKDTNKIQNLVGKISLNQSASVLQQAAKVITHDTGLMHIASAFKKEIIAIWGNTVPDFGMYPYLSKHINLEIKDLGCRPCSKIGFDTCPKGHFNCMEQQTFDIL